MRTRTLPPMVSQPPPARLHPHWVNFGLDEAAGRIWVMAPADGGRAADALLATGPLSRMAAWSLG
jgi:hypothetical protein